MASRGSSLFVLVVRGFLSDVASFAKPRLQGVWSLVVVTRGLSYPAAYGIFQDQGSNLYPRIDRQLLNHWTTREIHTLSFKIFCINLNSRLLNMRWNHPTPHANSILLFFPLSQGRVGVQTQISLTPKLVRLSYHVAPCFMRKRSIWGSLKFHPGASLFLA